MIEGRVQMRGVARCLLLLTFLHGLRVSKLALRLDRVAAVTHLAAGLLTEARYTQHAR